MLRLEKVGAQNVWALVKQQVREDQRGFVASNGRSLIEAYCALAEGGHAFPFGVYDGETPVGFLMIGYGAEESWADAPAVARDNYSLWRFMIEERYQGRGYGKQALQLALDFIRTWPCGRAGVCWLSYAPENAAARGLYRSFGFAETGEKDGDEIIAVLHL